MGNENRNARKIQRYDHNNIIDGDTIKTPGVFGGAFLGTVVAKTKKDGRIIRSTVELEVKRK